MREWLACDASDAVWLVNRSDPIAMKNHEMREVWNLVKDGTMVEIRPTNGEIKNTPASAQAAAWANENNRVRLV